MKQEFKNIIIVTAGCLIGIYSLLAQSATQLIFKDKTVSLNNSTLFDNDDVLEIKLKGNLHDLLNDRSGEPKTYACTIAYKGKDSVENSIPVDIKTRGHFRRVKGNCVYPPLLLQFPKTASSNTMFEAPVKLKLVMPCQGDDYVVREWLVYKLYNLVTPASFRARLVRVSMEDEKNKKQPTPFYGIILEDEKQMAKRNLTVAITRKLEPEQTVTDSYLKMAVFQYLIGNTDWSVQYQQNIKLIAADSLAIPVTVPYDFDHAGIVNAPYALPAEELEMSSVRERRYRGYCVKDLKVLDSAFACYNRLKNDMYHLYTNCSLLEPKYIKASLQYLDEFFGTINNPKAMQREFSYPCSKYGTGNVIIKGLKEN